MSDDQVHHPSAIGLIPLLLGVVIISFLLMKAAPRRSRRPSSRATSGSPRTRSTPGSSAGASSRPTPTPRSASRSATTSSSSAAGSGILNCNKTGRRGLLLRPGRPERPAGPPRRRHERGHPRRPRLRRSQSGRPVTDLIAERIPATFILAGTALVLWVSLAILLGVYAAVHRYSAVRPDDDVLQLRLLLAADVLARPEPDLHLRRRRCTGSRPAGSSRPADWPPFGTAQYWAAFGQRPAAAIRDIGRHLFLPVADPRRGQHRRRQPVRPGVDARVDQPGLRPDGQGQGPPLAGRHRQARLPQRDAAGRHERRPRDPVPRSRARS